MRAAIPLLRRRWRRENKNGMEGCVPNESRRVRVQLIRVHEDGTCARWRTEPGDLALILVLPARVPRKATGVAS